MNPLLEKLYYGSPVALQNLAVTLYGWKLNRERYSDAARSRLHELGESETFDPNRMRALLDQRFAATVDHALRTVPHWREWAADAGAVSGDFRSLDDIGQLPLLEKDQIREAPDRFISDLARARRGLIRLGTSGTTGTPLTVVCDRAARSHHYAFFSRLRGWFGLTHKSRRATLFGRIILSPDATRPPFWRYDAAQQNLLMSSYHLAPEHLPAYVGKLRDFAPDEVIGYPSSIYQLAHHVRTSGQPPLSPRVVFTTAETLLDYQREAIEASFSCPVIDQYGCTEMAFFASQCESGTMHVHPEHGWLEAVDESGEPVAPGKRGIAVATGFVNPVMPLVRYRVGDMVVLGEGNCACGRAFPVLEEVEGREDDQLLTPDGRPLGRMDPIFKGQSGVVECQIVQPDLRTLEFRMVVGDEYGAGAEAELLREIRKRTGPDMEIRFIPVSALPRSKSGKFKAVVREF